MLLINRHPWRKPWSLTESFIITGSLFIIGLFLNEFFTIPFSIPSWPYNFLMGIIFFILIILVHLFLKKVYFIHWLSSASAAIGAISLFSMVVLLMGLIPQDENNDKSILFDLNHIKHSWLFFMSIVYFLTVLGLVILRRIWPFTRRNIAFVFQHLGLWIIVFTASLASVDLQRYQILIHEGQTVNYGYNTNGEYILLPFAIKLNDFTIDEYPAKLAVVNTYREALDDKRRNFPLIEAGLKTDINYFRIEVLQYYSSAIKQADNTYVTSDDSLSTQAALIKIIDKRTNKEYQGWISSGSPIFKAEYIQLENYIIAMTIPQPRKFSSSVQILFSNNEKKNFFIEVNKPIQVAGWKLYQIGYDENMGKYSKISILEAVRDPWLPFVYIGILFLMIGIIFLFWTGSKIKNSEV